MDPESRAALSLNDPGPNPAARMLVSGFANTITLVYTDPLYHAFEDPATSAFVGGVAEACDQRGLGLLLLQGGRASPHTVQAAAVDGLIIYSMSKEGETIRSIAARGLPMVIVDQPLIPKVPFVRIDNRLAARSCAQHLKDLGHQDFAIVTFPLGSDGHCGLVDRKVFHRVEAGAFPEGLTLRARTPETRDRTVFFEVDRPSCSFETSVQHPPERVTVHGNTIPVTRERVINANYFFGWQSKKCYKGDLDFVDASSCLVEEIQGTRNDSSAGSRPGRQARGGTLSFWPT